MTVTQRTARIILLIIMILLLASLIAGVAARAWQPVALAIAAFVCLVVAAVASRR